MKLGRRQFLGTTVAGAAGAMTAGHALPASAAALDPVAEVPLGRDTDLKVPRIGFGTGMRGGNRESNHTRMGYEKLSELLLHAYDEGIRLFDLADMYGTHQFVARALKDKPRDSYRLVTKLWWRKGALPETERPPADVCVKRYLEELGVDRLDVVHLHCVTSSKWPEELRPYMDDLAKLKEEGLIRTHGVSCHSLGALEAAVAEPWVDVVHARINPYGTKMDDIPEKVVPALKRLHAAGKGVVGMKIIGEGQFGDDADKRQRSVEFVLGLGCVDTMIVGFEQHDQIGEFKGRVAKALRVQAS